MREVTKTRTCRSGPLPLCTHEGQRLRRHPKTMVLLQFSIEIAVRRRREQFGQRPVASRGNLLGNGKKNLHAMA